MIQFPFSITGPTQTLSAAVGSSSVSLTAGLRCIRVYNSGANIVFIRIGGAGTTATVADVPVPPGGVEVFSIGNATVIAGITATGTSSVYVTQGEGA